MNTANTTTQNINNKPDSNTHNWLWPLFACAVGAGILYLPINAGIQGIWPFIALLIITFPIIYLAHWNFTRFVLTASSGTTNINDIIFENYSKRFSNIFAFCYFFSMYPLIFIYTVGLTNTINSYIISNFTIEIPRFILAFVILFIIFIIVVTKESFIRKVTRFLALPLATVLFLLSLYLIPHWNLNAFNIIPTAADFTHTLFITLPTIIFTIEYMPIISTFALYHTTHSQNPETDTSNILWRVSLLIFLFTMFFVFSCIMTLEPNHMAIAKAENTNVLIYLGRLFNDPVLKIFAPLVAVISMTGACLSSFFGAKESVIGLIEQKLHQHKLQSNKLNYIAIALILIPCYILCILDTSILNLMSLLVGPVVALLLFIFPIYAVYTIPNLKKYHVTTFDKLKNYYVLLIGIIAFSAILYSFKYLLSYAS